MKVQLEDLKECTAVTHEMLRVVRQYGDVDSRKERQLLDELKERLHNVLYTLMQLDS